MKITPKTLKVPEQKTSYVLHLAFDSLGRAALLKFRLRNENSRTAIMDIGSSFQSRAARPEGTISFLKRLIIPSPNAS
ncbi:uncharacterized protein RSE6_09654 [Rhynchosporium secalis]|uniref:Uncharacterized protein n=1 Tax=Rhynchosporium secalis TaxID=38038 RepID=A0A1E1MIH4_RHYSE|nr:uncharacterized protein RSE6_09654 [Rhynchosporium secalis]